MILQTPTFLLLLLLSFISGGWITRLFFQKKIKKLKEELTAYKRSVDGLWELNEQKLKKSRTTATPLRDSNSSNQYSQSQLEEFNRSDSVQPTSRSSAHSQ